MAARDFRGMAGADTDDIPRQRRRLPGRPGDHDDRTSGAAAPCRSGQRGRRSRSSGWPAVSRRRRHRPRCSTLVLTGRRAFRRIPPARLDLADYYNPDPRRRDATYSTRAALLEGWRFDRAAFGVSRRRTSRAQIRRTGSHWRRRPGRWPRRGFPGGAGLPAERAGPSSVTRAAQDGAPAAALRLRWPYARRVLADALADCRSPGRPGGPGTAAAARTLPGARSRRSTARSLDGGSPASIATAICGSSGCAAAGLDVDAGGASSLAGDRGGVRRPWPRRDRRGGSGRRRARHRPARPRRRWPSRSLARGRHADLRRGIRPASCPARAAGWCC